MNVTLRTKLWRAMIKSRKHKKVGRQCDETDLDLSIQIHIMLIFKINIDFG